MSNESQGAADLTARVTRLESVVSRSTQEDRFDLREFVLALWRGKWFILITTALFTAVAAAAAFLEPDEYTAEVILVPASTNAGSSVAALAGQFGGLASLAGINLGQGGGGDRAAIAIALVKTWAFLDEFIREQKIEVQLIAAKGWDRASGKLIIDADLYDERQKKWTGKFAGTGDGQGEPSSWELYEELRDRVDISQDRATGLVTIAVRHYSPVIAKHWVDQLVLSINRSLRQQDQRDARRSIEYLQQQAQQTTLTEMQKVFYALIEEQTKNLMLAEVADEYALKTLSPSKVPERRSGPNRLLQCLLGVLLGLLTGGLVWLVLLRTALVPEHRAGAPGAPRTAG